MKTRQSTYFDFLGAYNTQMAIPVFQRRYTWGVWQCGELLDDIMRAGATGRAHFIGSIVYTMEGAGDQHPGLELINIIDGQQRTTTVTLLMIALRDYLAAAGARVQGRNAAGIERVFLRLPELGGIAKFTAAPADKDTLTAVLDKTELPESFRISNCILNNYRYFLDKMEGGLDLDQMWRGLEHLFCIVVRLEEDDNPQLIFESINAKGLGLATSDLLRNRLFFGNDIETQNRLLVTYWEPLEALFTGEKGPTNFNAALRAWLVEQDSELEKYNIYEFYSVFRKYIDEHYENATEQLMAELLESCSKFARVLSGPMVVKHLRWAKGEGETSLGSGISLIRTKREDL